MHTPTGGCELSEEKSSRPTHVKPTKVRNACLESIRQQVNWRERERFSQASAQTKEAHAAGALRIWMRRLESPNMRCDSSSGATSRVRRSCLIFCDAVGDMCSIFHAGSSTARARWNGSDATTNSPESSEPWSRTGWRGEEGVSVHKSKRVATPRTVVDDEEGVRRARIHQIQQLVLLRRQRRLRQQCHAPAHGVERRANLVAHLRG